MKLPQTSAPEHDLAKNLQKIMKEKGYTYTTLSRASGINKSKLFEWANGAQPRGLRDLLIICSLALTDLLRSLRTSLPGFKIENSKLTSSDFTEKDKVPDAIMTDPNTKSKWAIELELSAKSERRYREIVLSYRVHPEYQKVIYITLNDQIRNKVGSVITGFGKNYKPSDDTGKFYFAKLDDVLGQNEGSKRIFLNNGKDNIDLKSATENSEEILHEII